MKSVLWRQLDHPDATVDQRTKYHQYCGQGVQNVQFSSFVRLLRSQKVPLKFPRAINNCLLIGGGIREKKLVEAQKKSVQLPIRKKAD